MGDESGNDDAVHSAAYAVVWCPPVCSSVRHVRVLYRKK